MSSLIAACVFAATPCFAETSAVKEAASAGEAWLASATAKTTSTDGALLKRAQKTLLGNTIESVGWKPYRGVIPALDPYRGVWSLDAAFHAIGLSNWDPVLAREQFDILFDKQQPNGRLPDVVYENGTMVTSNTKPPVMAWAVAVIDHRAPDIGNLRKLYSKLVRLGDFWMKERGGDKDGLFFYAGGDVGWDAGWDDSIRWDNGYRHSKTDDKRLWAIDLNCYMVSHYRAMAYIAARLGLADEQAKWLGKADALAKRINERLWDDRLGSYVDRDRTSGKANPVLSPACFMPLFVHIAPPDRAARMAKLAADPRKFFPGMPSAAYDTPGFNPSSFWRGPTWLNVSFFAIKGLKDYGHNELANQMRETVLGWTAKNTQYIWEYYDSRTGEGLGAKGYGWSAAFTISFILDWDNDNLTWLFQEAPGCALGHRE